MTTLLNEKLPRKGDITKISPLVLRFSGLSPRVYRQILSEMANYTGNAANFWPFSVI